MKYVFSSLILWQIQGDGQKSTEKDGLTALIILRFVSSLSDTFARLMGKI